MSRINLQKYQADVNHFAMIKGNAYRAFSRLKHTLSVCVLIFKSRMGWVFFTIGGAL